jgi:hypothetical protein
MPGLWQKLHCGQKQMPVLLLHVLVLLLLMMMLMAVESSGRKTGLIYNAAKGLRSPPNATRPGYRISRGKANILRNLGASTETEVAQRVCGLDAIGGADCLNLLLLGLTPGAYSSNNTADTPGRRAFISPAQVRFAGILLMLHCCMHAVVEHVSLCSLAVSSISGQ